MTVLLGTIMKIIYINLLNISILFSVPIRRILYTAVSGARSKLGTRKDFVDIIKNFFI